MQERTGTKGVFRDGKDTMCCQERGGPDLYKITIISCDTRDVSFSLHSSMKHNFILLMSKFEGQKC